MILAQLSTFILFAVVALRVSFEDISGEVTPARRRSTRRGRGSTPLRSNRQVGARSRESCSAIFIYWGWDRAYGQSLRGEDEQPQLIPGISAIMSTVILLVIYVSVAVAVVAFHGTAH